MRAITVLIVVCLAAQTAPGAEVPAPSGLMCALLAHPEKTEITDPKPKFTWIVNSSANDDLQTAYQVRLAQTAAALEQAGDCLWDSGKVTSDRSVAVTYAGKLLEAHHSYCWKVRIWNKDGAASAWSDLQQFRTGSLAERTVARYPLEQTQIAPVHVIEKAKGHYFIDFGRAAFAALKLTVTSPAAGSKIVVHMGEARDGPQTVHRKPGGSIRYHRAELTLTAGTHTYTIPLMEADRRRMPPAIGPVMPFRYVEVEGCPSVLDKDAVRQVAAHYPFEDTAAAFGCSDPRLNDVWDLCHYTMKATSFCGVFVDGDRERLPYEADAYINQLGYYCCDREFSLARYSHEYLLEHPTWPTEWKQHSILMAWADYLYTGDTDSLAAHYERLKSEKLLTRAARADGLLNTKGLRDIVDWPLAERDGYQLKPVNTVVNAFHYQTLVKMVDIAVALGKPDEAAQFRHQAQVVKTAFNQKLFDPKTGLYVDGEGTAHSSLHANMFALAFGLVPDERRQRVVEFVKSRGMACSVYGAQYLMEALFEAGQADHAIALMTAPTNRSWTHMVHDVGSTMTLEAWDNKYKPNQDWNHAWGAAPANILPRKLMGVEPIEAGFRKIQIRPQPGGLKSAALDLPTVRGSVHVDFESSPSRWVMNVRLPANTTARVCVPLRGSADDPTVVVDGVRRRGKVEGSFLVIEPVGSGTHRFTRGE